MCGTVGRSLLFSKFVAGTAGGGAADLQGGTGVVSGRMYRNLRLHVGMARTAVKVEMHDKGDKFPGKAGLKHEEPLARNVIEFWDKMCRSSSRNRSRLATYLIPYIIKTA